MATRIIINGQSLGGWGELPPDLRQQYEGLLGGLEDKDGNGIPDVFEQDGKSLVRFDRSSEIIINGRRYASASAMPPEDRRLYDEMQAALRERGLGGFGEVASAALAAGGPPVSGFSKPANMAQSAPFPAEHGGSSLGCVTGVVLLLGGILIGLAIAVGAWLAFK